MANNKIYNPGHPSLAQRLNHQSKTRQAGYSKTNKDEVREFKRKVRDGVDVETARKGTRISAKMAKDILAGRTWASVVVLVAIMAVTMGNSCQDSNTYVCQGVNYPYCADVPVDYPCLCLSAPPGTQNPDRLRYLNDN